MAVRQRQSSKGPSSRSGTTSKPISRENNKKSKKACSCTRCMLIVACVLLSLYVSVPFILRYSHFVQKELIYVNRISIPFFANLSDPQSFNLSKSRHFNLEHENGCKIGVWQLLPGTYHDDTPTPEGNFPSLLSDGHPIILYLHGNTGTRATYSRILLYKMLTEERNYHLITFDYRGFGDSDCSPSEAGLMEDGLLVWQWVTSHAHSSKVYLWGHSLGSGATIYLATNLTADGKNPAGILLDAPFTSVVEAAYNHPFSSPYWIVLDTFRYLTADYFHETHPSIDRIAHVTCPILIMHGHHDVIVPFHMGYKLYEVAVATRKPGDGKVQFIDCGETSHKFNYHSVDLLNALDTFIQ